MKGTGKNLKKANGTTLERAVRLIIQLMRTHSRVDFKALLEDGGTYNTTVISLKTLNETWQLHAGTPLFKQVDEDGNPWKQGNERYLVLEDASLKISGATNLAIMPVFLQFLQMLKGTYLESSFRTVYDQGRANLSHKEKRFLASMNRKFHHVTKGLKDYSRHTTLIQEIYEALLRERVLQVKRDGEEKRLHPLSLVVFNNGLYLVAVDAANPHGEAIKYRVEKFEKAKCTDHPFAYPLDYDPAKLFKDSFGLYQEDGVEHVVELQILTESAEEYIRARKWTSNDEYFERDGCSCLRFKTSSLVEVASWVLSFGEALRVLGPVDLRERVADRARRAAALYSK